MQCKYVAKTSSFLKTLPNVLSVLKAVLMFSRFKVCLIRSDTPLTYGIDAYASGLFRGFGCVLFGWPTDLMNLIMPILSRRWFPGSISLPSHVVSRPTSRLRQGNGLAIKTWKESLHVEITSHAQVQNSNSVNGHPFKLRMVDLTLPPTLILCALYIIICRC